MAAALNVGILNGNLSGNNVAILGGGGQGGPPVL